MTHRAPDDAGAPDARPRSGAPEAEAGADRAMRDGAPTGFDPTALLAVGWDRLTPGERQTIERVLRRELVARDAMRDFEDRRTLGERLADRIAAFGGSWTFILLFLSFLVAWAAINTEVLGPRHRAFDPYPYIFLNLMLSMLAAIQAPIIMMAQNRQAARDRYDAAADYAVNLKAELEIQRLHARLSALEAELGRLGARRDAGADPPDDAPPDEARPASPRTPGDPRGDA